MQRSLIDYLKRVYSPDLLIPQPSEKVADPPLNLSDLGYPIAPADSRGMTKAALERTIGEYMMTHYSKPANRYIVMD